MPVLVNESKGVGDRVEGQICRPVEVGLRAVAVLTAPGGPPLGYQLPVKKQLASRLTNDSGIIKKKLVLFKHCTKGT